VFKVTRERARRAKILIWLVGALVAFSLIGGFALGVFAGGSKNKPRPATAVLGVQVGGPNSVNGSNNGNGSNKGEDCSTDVKPNGKLPPCPKSFGLSGTITGLYPGATLNLPVLVTNQNNQDIKVNQIQISVIGTDKSGCAPSASNLIPTNYTGPGFNVPRNSSQTIQLPITMPHGAANACQGATFTLKYTGKAVKP
jgi:hypothetical protein